MTSRPPRRRWKPGSPLGRGLGLYLAACLVVSGIANWSPWLHQILEHGSLDWTSAHVHWRGGRGVLAADFFAGFEHSPSVRPEAHRHPHPHASGHVHADGVAADTGPGSESGRSSEVPGHVHQGLPGLLAAGLVDLAGPALMGLLAWSALMAWRLLTDSAWTEVSRLDWAQAARPPPWNVGGI